MTSILNFIRQGFSQLESIPIDDIDTLFDEIYAYQTNPNRLSNQQTLQNLIAKTGYFYQQVGKKISLVQAIKDKQEKQIDYRIELAAKKLGKKLTYETKKDIEAELVNNNDIEYLSLINNFFDVSAMYTLLKNTHNAIFLQHYSLRNQNINEQNQAHQINNFS